MGEEGGGGGDNHRRGNVEHHSRYVIYQGARAAGPHRSRCPGCAGRWYAFGSGSPEGAGRWYASGSVALAARATGPHPVALPQRARAAGTHSGAVPQRARAAGTHPGAVPWVHGPLARILHSFAGCGGYSNYPSKTFQRIYNSDILLLSPSD